jgi:hypothetical protein
LIEQLRGGALRAVAHWSLIRRLQMGVTDGLDSYRRKMQSMTYPTGWGGHSLALLVAGRFRCSTKSTQTKNNNVRT